MAHTDGHNNNGHSPRVLDARLARIIMLEVATVAIGTNQYGMMYQIVRATLNNTGFTDYDVYRLRDPSKWDISFVPSIASFVPSLDEALWIAQNYNESIRLR